MKLHFASLTLIRFLCGAAVAIVACIPRASTAQPSLYTSVLRFGNETPFVSRQQTGAGPTLSDTVGGPFSSQSTFVSFGNSRVVYNAVVPGVTSGNPPQAFGGPNGKWKQVQTFTPTDPALMGTPFMLRTTYHATGHIAASWGEGATGSAFYRIYVDGGGAYTFPPVGYQGPGCTGGCEPDAQPLSNFNSFTIERSATFGVERETIMEHGLAFNLRSGSGSASGSADITLSTGTVQVLNAQGNPISYTSESSSGRARSEVLPTGGSYAGLSLTNDTNNGHVGTTVILRDGAASGPGPVTLNFIGIPGNLQAVSDSVSVSGTGTNPVVIQLSYSPALAQGFNLPEEGLRLAWLNPATGQWVNAVVGNTGGAPNFFARAYNPSTDFQVGNFGVDAANKVVWAVVNHNSQFVVGPVPDPFALTGAVSRKTHGSSGTFDIPVALTTPSSVECRTGGATGEHTLVFTFSGNVASGTATVTAGNGSVSGTPIFTGNTMTVALSGVANQQRLTVSLNNIANTASQVLPNTEVTLGFLLGDTSGSGTVNASDIGQTKAQSGQPVSATNFRTDVTANGGAISASDIGQVKSTAGTQLP